MIGTNPCSCTRIPGERVAEPAPGGEADLLAPGGFPAERADLLDWPADRLSVRQSGPARHRGPTHWEDASTAAKWKIQEPRYAITSSVKDPDPA
jgi:hypothetical protein